MPESTLNQARLIDMVEKMPAFPRSVQKVLSMTARPDIAPKALVGVIERDPVLTGKVLKVVNSAYFGLSRQLTSIKHAVVFVGINTIKHLALSVAAIGALPQRNQAGLAMDAYLRHSLATGTIARLLARRVEPNLRDIEDFFLAGLIHDIGKVVLAIYLPAEYTQVLRRAEALQRPVHEVEFTQLGVTHSQISALLARRWQLPDALITAIERHHTAPIAGSSTLDFCLFAGNQVADGLDMMVRSELPIPVEPKPHHFPPGFPVFPPSVVDRLGFDLITFLGESRSIRTEIERAQIFIKV